MMRIQNENLGDNVLEVGYNFCSKNSPYLATEMKWLSDLFEDYQDRDELDGVAFEAPLLHVFQVQGGWASLQRTGRMEMHTMVV